VINLGLSYTANENLTLRAGLNMADNPIPDAYVNPLFPATVTNHFTVGLGYKLASSAQINLAVTSAPTTTVNNGGMSIAHGQTNVQMMYTQRF
jgi:long-chain fatty acid transport protein